MQHPSSSAMPGQAQVRGTHQLTAEILSAVNSQGMSLGPSRRDPARRSRKTAVGRGGGAPSPALLSSSVFESPGSTQVGRIAQVAINCQKLGLAAAAAAALQAGLKSDPYHTSR